MKNAFSNALAQAMQLCIVSLAVKEEGFIAFAYREAAEFENDSGWRFFSGSEDDAFNNQSENFVVFQLNELQKLQPELKQLFEVAKQEKGAWLWDEEKQLYQVFEEWQSQNT